MTASAAPTMPRHLALGRHRLPLPRTRTMRLIIGGALILGGVLPLLPPGPGGIALGFAIISVDYPGLRRLRRKLVVQAGRPLKRMWMKFRRPALAV